MENKVTNVNEDIFTKKWEEYKKVIDKKRKYKMDASNNK